MTKPWQSDGKRLRWFASVWASAAYVLLLFMPMYGRASDSLRPDGSRTITTGTATLADVNGPRIYLILAVPVFAALLTILPWPRELRRAAGIVGATIATAFALVGMMTVGMFFIPTAVALIAAALVSETNSPS